MEVKRMFYSTEEVAEILGVSTQTACRLAINGEVPAKKFGRQWRFPVQAFDHWVKAGLPVEPEAKGNEHV
jgi:excisionase family DNA binding protein